MLRKHIVVSVPRDPISQAHLEHCNRTPAVAPPHPPSTYPGISHIRFLPAPWLCLIPQLGQTPSAQPQAMLTRRSGRLPEDLNNSLCSPKPRPQGCPESCNRTPATASCPHPCLLGSHRSAPWSPPAPWLCLIPKLKWTYPAQPYKLRLPDQQATLEPYLLSLFP